MTAQRPSDERPITGRMVLVGLLAFFGVVLAANGAMVFLAVDSWSGLSTERPFEAGRDHDRTLARAEAQAALGWTSAVAIIPRAEGGQTAEVALTTAAGAGLGGLTVELRWRRPARGDLDRSQPLREAGAGRYAGEIALPLPGRWYAEIRARNANGLVYRMEHEVMVAE